MLAEGRRRRVGGPLDGCEHVQDIYDARTGAADATAFRDRRSVAERFQAELDLLLADLRVHLEAVLLGRRHRDNPHGLVMAAEALTVLRVVGQPLLDAVERLRG